MTFRFNLSLDDYNIILNALHYYKKVDKQGPYQRYDDETINTLRDLLVQQFVKEQ